MNSPFSGYIYYDAAAAPFSESNFDSGNFASYLAPGSFFITLPGSTIGSEPSSSALTEASIEDHNALLPQPPTAVDALRFYFDDVEINGPLAAEAPGNQGFTLGLFGSTRVLDSAQLATAIRDLSQWNPGPPDGGITFGASANSNPFLYFSGHLTGLRSSAVVPEPSYALATPLLFAIGCALRKRKS